MPPIVISTTSDDQNELKQIARRLIDQRLAACCQMVGPLTSIYRWDRVIEESQEWICLIKTEDSQFEAVEKTIREHHHYDLPEIIATPITSGSAGYLKWIADSVGDPD